MTLGRAWGEGTCMGGFTAFSASAQTGADGTPHLRRRVPAQQMVPHEITGHLTARHTAVVPVAVGHVIELERHFPQSATGQGGAFARPCCRARRAWRINLNKPRVFSMYKFSSLPRAISAATAIASWASSSSDDGGAPRRRAGGGPAHACLLRC